ncbi:MAG: Hint domain-containing protein, partial [Acetobacteraceae bacterium]
MNQGSSASGTGFLAGAELFASASGTVVSTGTLNNIGTIIGTVTLLGGTGLVNESGGTIIGYAYAPSGNTSGVTVTNLGVIDNTNTTFGYGVREFYTGTVTNGSVSDATASIAGFSGGIYLGGSIGAVTNYGTISGTGATGDSAVFVNRGSVANLGTAAVISGASAGVLVWYSGAVVNQGTIRSAAGAGVRIGARGPGGGTVVNGGAGDTVASIVGYRYGVQVGYTVATVTNFGTIGSSKGWGIDLAGGTVINGGTLDPQAVIYGAGNLAGLESTGTIAISNDGTIRSSGGKGVYIDSGSITNGAAGQTGALISGGQSAIDVFVGGTVTNYGSIVSTYTDFSAVYFKASGVVSNAAHALIQGAYRAIDAVGTASIVNQGTILGTNVTYSAVALAGGTIVNQSGGLIQGVSYNAISLAGTGLIVNDLGGTIAGANMGVELGGGTIDNAGTILGLGSLGAAGIGGSGSSTLTIANSASGVISGTRFGVDLSGAAVVSNAGTIAGGIGAYLNPGSAAGGGQLSATLTNAGTLIGSSGTAAELGQSATLVIDPGALFVGTVTNAGTAQGWQMVLGSAAAAGTLSGLGTQFTGFGGIQLAAGATWTLVGTNTPAYVLDITGGAGTLVNAGVLVLSAGPSGGIGFAQQIDPALLVNTGTILASPASYAAIYSGLTGSGGVLQIVDTGKLAAQGTVAAGQNVIFAGTTAAGVLHLSDPTGFAGTIDNFLPGDTIVLAGTAASGSMAAGNTLEVTLTAGTTLALAFDPTQSFANDTFHFAALPGGAGTAITDSTPCYLAGTRILTDRGERTVETLAPGDVVITHSGAARPIRWIGRRSFAAAFAAGNREVVPIRIRAGALAEGVPARDLYVSPQHALLLDGALVPAELLVNQVSILRCPDIDPIRYFHLELDSHDILLAEGAPAESFVDCDSRGMFHNAAEHDGTPTARWRFCAPRLDSGPLLEAIRARIDARAGLGPATALGPLEGFLDPPTADRIDGWARDGGAHPVLLEVLVDGGLVARLPADRFREDLHAAGIGDGRHGFSVSLPVPLSLDRRHEITVRRAADGALLPGAPRVLEPVALPDTLAVTRRIVAAAVDRATDPAQAAALLAGLREASARLRTRVAAAAPGPARRALVIDARLPRPDRDAGSVALVSHIEALRALGWTVDAIGADEPALTEAATAPLAALGVEALGLPELASVEEALRAAPERYQLIYLHRLAQAEAYAWLARRLQPRARILYNVADLHHLRLERQARISGDLGLMAEARILRARELAAMRAADAVLTHSGEEAGYLAREAPGARVHVVPWSQPGRPVSLPFAARRGMALIGAPSHAPNADAARWLREEILPRVWAEAPDVPCYLVGEGWAAHWPADADPRIQVLGPLARLDGLFEMIRLTVAPLRFGAGIKGKVLASLAAGLPCAMTPVAAEGLRLTP